MSKYREIRRYTKKLKNAMMEIFKKNIKIFLFNFLLISGNNLFSKNKENNDNNLTETLQVKNENEYIQKVRERGIEKMNFYIPISQQNKFITYGEADFRQDKYIYKHILGEGYMALNSNWDFNYRITKEFYRYKIEENKKNNSNLWDNEISFSRKNKNFKIGNHEWSSNFLFGVKHIENNMKITDNTRDYKFYLTQKISAFFPNLGKGGTFTEYGITFNGIKGSVRNGYSILGSISSGTSLGYGFQWNNSFESEFVDYNLYKNALKIKYETVFRWTYELGKHFAFSPEIVLKAEKYFNHKIGNLTLESSLGTYLLYSKNFSNKFRIYGKAGPTLRYDRTKYDTYQYKKSQFGGYAKIGLEYVF